MISRRLSCVVLVLVAVAVPAFAQQPPVAAGRVKLTSGAAVIVRAGAATPAQPGQVVYESDLLKTGPDGRLGITLKDDTRIALGPGSEVRVDHFVYAPEQGHLGLALNVLRGLMTYVSGRIAKLSPDAVRLETPSAVVGVRGTTLAIHASPE